MLKLNKVKNTDGWFILIILTLCIIGGLTVFSSTYFLNNSVSQLFFNQLFFYVTGILIFIGLSVMDISKLNNRFIIAGTFLVSTTLLIIVLILGNVAYGAQR